MTQVGRPKSLKTLSVLLVLYLQLGFILKDNIDDLHKRIDREWQLSWTSIPLKQTSKLFVNNLTFNQVINQILKLKIWKLKGRDL